MTNEILRKIYRSLLVGAIIILAMLIYILFFHKPYYGKNRVTLNKNTLEQKSPSNKIGNKNFTEQKITSNTVRIQGENMYKTTVAITQVAYPSNFAHNRPNAVILVREDKIEDAILAGRISHEPINAPILYIKKDYIPEETLKEIERLKPRGVFLDGNIKIILIGDVDVGVLKKLNDQKLKYRHINGENTFSLSLNIDNYLAAIQGDHKDAVIIAPIEEPEYALPQLAWNAHAGDGFFFIEKDKIPMEVEKALNNRHGNAYIYILAREGLISKATEDQLSRYGHVQRIPMGEDAYSMAVGFARYKDVGKNFSWWLGTRPRDFGWGISKPGHSFTFVNPKQWQIAVTSSILSHKGKHGPMLLVEENKIPDEVKNYLQTLKPSYNSSQEHLYNHGWIIGSEDSISNFLQAKIDELLDTREYK